LGKSDKGAGRYSQTNSVSKLFSPASAHTTTDQNQCRQHLRLRYKRAKRRRRKRLAKMARQDVEIQRIDDAVVVEIPVVPGLAAAAEILRKRCEIGAVDLLVERRIAGEGGEEPLLREGGGDKFLHQHGRDLLPAGVTGMRVIGGVVV